MKRVVSLLIALFGLTLGALAPAQNYKRADSRKPYVHRIPLFDVAGRSIGANSHEPYSPRKTCGPCHDVPVIEQGLHSDAAIRKDPLRDGEPWVFRDSRTGTVIPVSPDKRPGVFEPEALGLDPHAFLRTFGSHLVGGGETLVGAPAERGRFLLTGSLELDCMACHEAGARWDQGAWAKAIHKDLLRWAPTAAMGFASVEGSLKGKPVPGTKKEALDVTARAVRVLWRPEIFDQDGKVFFDVVRKAPDAACQACHGDLEVGPEAPARHLQAEDVHASAGLSCVDCHRSGLDHEMIRGLRGSPGADEFSCAGCHLESGRLGAPRPRHVGFPALHFDHLSCTACHAGPTSPRVHLQTPRAHGLGIASQDRSEDDPPRVSTLLLSRLGDGRLAPAKVFWPSFWARRKGEVLTPLAPSAISRTLRRALRVRKSLRSEMSDPRVFQERMTKALAALSSPEEGEAVFVAGNRILSLGPDGTLRSDAADRELTARWSLGHPVRPARQALGAHGCEECHEGGSNLLAARVEVDRTVPGSILVTRWAPLDVDTTTGLGRMARTWRLRRLFKWLLWAGGALVTVVLIAALGRPLRLPSSGPVLLLRAIFLLTTGLLVGTSFTSWWRGEAISGIPLLAHMPLGLIWIWSLVANLAVRSAEVDSRLVRVSRFLMFLAAWATTVAALGLFTAWFDQEGMAILLRIHRWASLAAGAAGLPLWLRLRYLNPA
ncbi:MAG TPA: hypothetical protein ENK43_04135 [Planctomycetes bacterium]|nr:hypothetical protein [Planctomycetota bacterium]